MKNAFTLLLIAAILACTACSETANSAQPERRPGNTAAEPDWEEQLIGQIAFLGHRNWIVVADAAYPLQSNPGITTLMSSDSHRETISRVKELIETQTHIKAITYLDKEIDFVRNEDAPGIADFRSWLAAHTDAALAHKLLHEEIIARLDSASSMYNVVIVKTDFSLPYTSVFFELDCKYWNADAEQRLRDSMN